MTKKIHKEHLELLALQLGFRKNIFGFYPRWVIKMLMDICEEKLNDKENS